MRKNYGYKYFSKQRKKSILKKISFINSLLLIVQISLGSLFYVMPAAESRADNGNLCQKPVDVVLVMDRSGSMDYTSRCDSWQLQCLNSPSCSQGYSWIQKTEYNLTEAQCNLKNQTAPHQSVYLAINPKKIVAAKNAASNFLDLMGVNDKSSLISYANTASLDKGLSSDHSGTKASVNSLIAVGATDIGDAIKLGVEELKSLRANPQATHAMILLTDGLANKPNGPGFGEFAADVAYAQSQAVLAAGYGFKIFTIGLGVDGEINETMLENIAATTGATYHHSPTQNDLQSIYDSISNQVCQYGSISGCKYSDVNKDGSISGEEKLSGWEIKLNDNENFSQLTDANGCYQFSGLTPGAYTVSEGGKIGVVSEQTYPDGGSYNINLADGENVTNKDFGNYLAVCGNSFVDTGYTGYTEACEIGQSQTCVEASYSGSQSCKADCSGWNQCVSNESCGDGVINNGEPCDGTAGVSEHYTCTSSCTLEYLPYCGDSLINLTGEQCDNSAPESCATGNGYSGTRECAAGCIWADCSSTQSCGDGAINGSEICDDGTNNGQPNYCSSTCTGQTPAVCGNGAKEGSEQCDGTAGVGANQSCTTSCTLDSLPYCGDSLVNQTSEQCDGGSLSCTAANNYSGLQSCNSSCQWGSCTATQSCGDGAKNGNEACDGTDGIGAHQSCSNTCALVNEPYCGDNIKNGVDQCDGTAGVGAHQSCSASCSLINNPYCGDGLVNQTPEQCDGTAGVGAHQSCSATCTLNNLPYCGDNLVNGSEICDGNSQSCQFGVYGGAQLCNSTCSGWQTCQTTQSCGDNIKNGSEQCDGTDGIGAHQSCSNICALVNLPYCGDGVKNGTDQCDGTSGVGAHQSCSASCTLINNSYCGDGLVNQTSEQCDGTAGVGAHQSCSATCALNTLPYCGDNTINNAEVCDGGSQLCQTGGYNGLEPCNTTCSGYIGCVATEFCGDGTKNGSEQCDDGNTASEDGCSATCQSEGGSGGGDDKGSLKICKYEDADGNILTASNQLGISDWSFSAGNSIATSSQLTLADGCTVFSALTPGQYQVNEESRTGWYYLEPISGSATATVTANQQTEVKFYNVRHGKITGYEYADVDGLVGTAGDRSGLDNWTINLFNPLSSTTPLLSTTTRADGYFEFADLLPDTYSLRQNLKTTWINLINPADITLSSGQINENNNFVNSQSGGQGGNGPVCGDGIKDDTEQCDGADGVTSGYTCNSQCVLVANQTGGGGGGGGNFLPCFYTNTCGGSPGSGTITAGPTGPSGITVTPPSPSTITPTGEVIGQKITAKPNGEVLGQKITAKPDGKVLAVTGFKFYEFITLFMILLLILNLIFIIKTKYLKTTVKRLNWLKKTLIFNSDLFIYERADNYFKNR